RGAGHPAATGDRLCPSRNRWTSRLRRPARLRRRDRTERLTLAGPMTGLTALGSVAAAHLGRLTAADAPPLDIGREEAARAAQEELERAIYRDEEAGLVSRAI